MWLRAAQTELSENRKGSNRRSENRRDNSFAALADQGSLPMWLRAAQTELSENRKGVEDDQDRAVKDEDLLTNKLATSKEAAEALQKDLETLEKVEEMLEDDLLELEEEILEIIESNAKKAGCDRDCLICLSAIKCTDKMVQYIPGRCHKFPGIDETDQGAISGVIIDIPEIVGFIEMEPP